MSWIFIIIAYLTLFSYGILDNVRGPVYPDIIKDFNINSTLGALFFSLSSLMSFVGSLICHKLLKHFTLFNTNRIGLLFIALGTIGISLSPNYLTVLFFTLFFGIGMGISGITVNLIVQKYSPEKKLRQLISGLHSCYGLSALLAPLVVSICYYYSIHWRVVFLVISLIPLLILIKSSNEKKTNNEVNQNIKKSQNEKQFKKNRLLFAIMLAAFVTAELTGSTRLALYMQTQMGSSPITASNYVTLFFLFLFLSRIILTLNLKIQNRTLLVYSAVFSIIFWILGLWIHPLFIALSAFTIGPMFPVSVTYAKEKFKDQADSVISYSISFVFITLFIIHSLIGFITDSIGIKPALHIAIFSLIVFLIIFRIREKFDI